MFRFKKTFLTSSLLLIILSLSSQLYAQMIDKSTIEKDESKVSFINEDKQIVQKFSWEGNKNIFRYEFVLEKQDSYENYQFVTMIDTRDTQVEVTIDVGKYRYSLNVYNFLNSLDYKTDWVYIELIRTANPIITEIYPPIIYLEEEQNGIFTIEGFELNPDTVFTFENDYYEIAASTLETSPDGHKSRILIDPKFLNIGKYYIRATNPGNLYDTSDTIRVTFKKPYDLDISAGYAPVILTRLFDTTDYDGITATSLIEFFGNNPIWPLGLNGKITFIPLKTTRFYLGGGLSANLFWLDYTNKDEKSGITNYTIHAPSYSVYADVNMQFVLRKKLPFKIVADLHGGVGTMGFGGMWIKFANNTTTANVFSAAFSANAGGAIQVYLANRLYIEGNCDIAYTQMKDMPVFQINPSISAGWQF